ERAVGTVQQRLQLWEVVEHGLDDGGIDGAGCGVGYAQIVEHGQRWEDLASLRHVADSPSCLLMRWQGGDVLAAERDAAAGRVDLLDESLQERGLAHAVVAEDADELALR